MLRPITALVRWVQIPAIRRTPSRAAVPVAVLAISVATILTLDAGSVSVIEALWRGESALRGGTTHQILPGPLGLDETLLTELETIDGVDAATPVVEGVGTGRRPFVIRGVDPRREPALRPLGGLDDSVLESLVRGRGGVIVSQELAERERLELGDAFGFDVGARHVVVDAVGILPTRVADLPQPQNLMLCDLATARDLLHTSSLTRIDLLITHTPKRPILRAVRAAIPVDARVVLAEDLPFDSLLRELRTRTLPIVVAVLVASLALLIVFRRRSVDDDQREWSVLRCLGTTRRQLRTVSLLEGLAYTVLGTVVGWAVGMGGTLWGLDAIARLLPVDVLPAQVATVVLPPSSFVRASIAGLVLGLGASLDALARPHFGRGRPRPEATLGERPRPRPVAILDRFGRPIASLAADHTPPTLRLVVAELRTFSVAHRGSLLVATLALAVTIGILARQSSYEAEFRHWADRTQIADLYLGPATDFGVRTSLDPALLARLRDDAAVQRLDLRAVLSSTVDGRTADLVVRDFRHLDAPPLVADGTDRSVVLDRVRGGQVVLSVRAAQLFDKQVGDPVVVKVRGRRLQLRVGGIVHDHSSVHPVLWLDQRVATRLLGTVTPTHAAVHLRPGTAVSDWIRHARKSLDAEFVLRWQTRSRHVAALHALQFGPKSASGVLILAGLVLGIVALATTSRSLARNFVTRSLDLRRLGLTSNRRQGILVGQSTLIAVASFVVAVACGGLFASILVRLAPALPSPSPPSVGVPSIVVAFGVLWVATALVSSLRFDLGRIR